jgi:hypothetical protein
MAPSSDNLTSPFVGKEVIDRFYSLVGEATEGITIEIAEIGIGNHEFALKVSQRVILI